MKLDQKILIEYLYKKDKIVPVINYKMDGPNADIKVIKGRPIGVVVAIGSSIIGWSLCDKKDKFNKKVGLELALIRANLAAAIDSEYLESFYLNSVPFTLSDLVYKMNERSLKYFQED